MRAMHYEDGSFFTPDQARGAAARSTSGV